MHDNIFCIFCSIYLFIHYDGVNFLGKLYGNYTGCFKAKCQTLIEYIRQTKVIRLNITIDFLFLERANLFCTIFQIIFAPFFPQFIHNIFHSFCTIFSTLFSTFILRFMHYVSFPRFFLQFCPQFLNNFFAQFFSKFPICDAGEFVLS